MGDTWEKIIALGLGTLAVTKEKAEELVKELMKEGQVNRQEADQIIKKLVKRGEASKKELNASLEKAIHEVMKKLDIPSRAEVEKLKAEIARLKKTRASRAK